MEYLVSFGSSVAQMRLLFHFEMRRLMSGGWLYVILLCTLGFGLLIGLGASISMGPGLFKNSPYLIGIMEGFLSLFAIFFCTLWCTMLLFKEQDHRFAGVYYALPIRTGAFVWSRIAMIWVLGALCLTLLVVGFGLGQQMAADRSRYLPLQVWHYVVPWLTMGLANTLFCTVLLCAVAWLSRNKMLVYVSGILLYIFYMLMLLFSGSPLMSKGMPQSVEVIRWTALLDPFGLSGFFEQTARWSVARRNGEVVWPAGLFLANRLGWLAMSASLSWLILRQYSWEKALSPAQRKINSLRVVTWLPRIPWPGGGALSAIVRTDLQYLTRGIPFVLMCIGMLFAVGMEMFGDIERGIRMPQRYADSGLLASTILDEFPMLCLLALIFYAHDLFWRSRLAHFDLIEGATPLRMPVWLAAKWAALSLLVLWFCTLMVLLGLVFQWLYGHLVFDWQAYGGVYVLVGYRLVVIVGWLLMVQWAVPHRWAGLALSLGLVILLASPIGNRLFDHPLIEGLMPFRGQYTDLNGYGPYLMYFVWRYSFALVLLWVVAVCLAHYQSQLSPRTAVFCLLVLSVLGGITGWQVADGYQPKDPESAVTAAAEYEKRCRRFQSRPQPTVTQVTASIALYPADHHYLLQGHYTLQNRTDKPIDSVLLNVDAAMEVLEMQVGDQPAHGPWQVIGLARPLAPGDTMQMRFRMRYGWRPVNGHQSFNAIVANGTFVRVSRYFPQIGYLPEQELSDLHERTRAGLGEATQPLPPDVQAPYTDDFIHLDLTISTEEDQIAIGVGELAQQWQTGGRAYFRYVTREPIPFRFGVSSARYACQKVQHQGITIEVYYHPLHAHNVRRLLTNSRQTLDYCIRHFGPSPFGTIRFAEVSGFTKGFAATAYPATIFMTENMIFDANIENTPRQDVINELAAHELSHLWWGNNRISPANREGASMLTETLAMYTELMLAKKMYGTERMRALAGLYLRMYLDDRGYEEERPLYRVQDGQVHLSYYKGAVVMYQLAERIGEDRLNCILKNFMDKHAYPAQHPVTTDLLAQLYAGTDSIHHAAIAEAFEQIVVVELRLDKAVQRRHGKGYELDFVLGVQKWQEDGKGAQIPLTFEEPVEIACVLADGQPIRIQARQGRQQLVLAQPVRQMIVDPDLHLVNIHRETVYQVEIED